MLLLAEGGLAVALGSGCMLLLAEGGLAVALVSGCSCCIWGGLAVAVVALPTPIPPYLHAAYHCSRPRPGQPVQPPSSVLTSPPPLPPPPPSPAVPILANPPPQGQVFDHWATAGGQLTFSPDAFNYNTSVMSHGFGGTATVTATYKVC